MADRLSGSQQENLLVLLAFSESCCQLVRNSVDPSLFSSDVFRDIVERVSDYIDRFKKPPASHLPDLFDDILNTEHKQRPIYEDVLRNVYELSQGINEDYVLGQLEHFVRRQQLKLGIVAAGDAIQTGKEEDLERAEVILEAALKQRLSLFRKGSTLEEGLKRLSAKEEGVGDCVFVGIKDLDMRRLVPTRKTMHTFIASSGKGKSWWLTHVAKRALLQRWKVLVVSLEMSEDEYIQRLLQSLFAVSKRKGRYMVTRFERDTLDRLIELKCNEQVPKDSFDDDTTFARLSDKLKNVHPRRNLIVRQFPTRSLTMNGFRAYLDALERTEQFIPDIVLLDYPKLMNIDPKNFRIELGMLFEDLRGMAVDRNIAVCAAHQSNRSGATAKVVLETDAQEDWSLVATSDHILTYTQSLKEKAVNLARLFVAKGRTDDDKFMLLISQAYTIGQFCLDTVRMTDTYQEHLDAASRNANQGSVTKKPRIKGLK